MRIIDPGHQYLVEALDNGATQLISFVKREGPDYSGNFNHYAGTNCQELLRVLIDRVKYLDAQIACAENTKIIELLRTALEQFEIRAARRHGELPPFFEFEIEHMPVRPDGHIAGGTKP